MTESTNTTIMYDVVMKAVTQLPDKEKEILMSYMTIKQLANLLYSKDELDNYMQSVLNVINEYNSLTSALIKICNYLTEGHNVADEIVSDYDKLDVNERKQAALNLLNNADFQKNCCDILIADMERAVESDASVKAFNSVIDIVGWCKKMIRNGIGIHHYEG